MRIRRGITEVAVWGHFTNKVFNFNVLKNYKTIKNAMFTKNIFI